MTVTENDDLRFAADNRMVSIGRPHEATRRVSFPCARCCPAANQRLCAQALGPKKLQSSRLIQLVRPALVLLLLAATATRADVDTFQEGVNGYTGNQDTYLDEQFPTTANGGAGSVLVENNGGQRQHGLIRFDSIFGPGADQIPFGSVINSASLAVNVTNPSSSGAQIRLHRMMPLATWPEIATWNSMAGGIQTDDA